MTELEMKYFVMKLTNGFKLDVLIKELDRYKCSHIRGKDLAKIIVKSEDKDWY